MKKREGKEGRIKEACFGVDGIDKKCELGSSAVDKKSPWSRQSGARGRLILQKRWKKKGIKRKKGIVTHKNGKKGKAIRIRLMIRIRLRF